VGYRCGVRLIQARLPALSAGDGLMKFGHAVDEFIVDMRSQGRINSDATETNYRFALSCHAQDVNNRDPRTTNRDDVKRTLRRWENANTQRVRRATLVSFYDWCMEEGVRKDNPARQTRRPKRRPTTVYRMTLTEAGRLIDACKTRHEQYAITLGMCCGLRNAELRGLQGRHFQRDGFLHVSADIAKGGRERWVPLLPELANIVDQIRLTITADEYVLCAQRWRDPGTNTIRGDLRTRPLSAQALYYLVQRVGARAGISAPIHPHLLRHAFGDHIARHAGMRNAQFLLGHANVATTETYVGKPTLDDLAASVEGFGFSYPQRDTPTHPPENTPKTPGEARTGLEPVWSASRSNAGDLGTVPAAIREWLNTTGVRSVAIYAEAFHG
jgi:site-specific recombinase XerD